jgi:hypothetical protein
VGLNWPESNSHRTAKEGPRCSQDEAKMKPRSDQLRLAACSDDSRALVVFYLLTNDSSVSTFKHFPLHQAPTQPHNLVLGLGTSTLPSPGAQRQTHQTGPRQRASKQSLPLRVSPDAVIAISRIMELCSRLDTRPGWIRHRHCTAPKGNLLLLAAQRPLAQEWLGA